MGASGGWFVADTASMRYSRAGRARGVLRCWSRSGGFRMVQLNVVGWAALLVTGATLGLLTAWCGGASVLAGVAVGAAVAWALALVVDTVRWRGSDIYFSCPDVPRATLDRVVRELQAGGVDASIEVDMQGSNADKTVFQIRSRMRFRIIVERQLAELNTS
jgi:hypothetical protein